MDLSRFLDFKNRRQLVLDAILWLVEGSILLWVGNLLQTLLSLRLPFIVYSPEPIRIAAFSLFVILLFILSKDLWRWIKVHWWIFWNRNKSYIFSDKDWPTRWISNGKTEISDEGYLFVKSSRAGCLLKDSYWKDFKMSFEMRFLDEKDHKILGYQKRLGLVFRAEDLDNYFMVEIGDGVEDDISLSVKPHIRYKGGWEWMSVEEIKKSLDFSNFVKVSLEVKEDTVRLFYNGDSFFKWVLPTHVDVNHVESGVQQDKKDKSDEYKNIVPGKSFAGHVQEIPFRLGYGLVGFRAYMKHGAIIRNLRIERL